MEFNFSGEVSMRRLFAAFLVAGLGVSSAAVVIQNLKVEYRPTPIGIDERAPRFGWQMAATAGERGLSQKAWQIEVRDAKGQVAWSSGRTEESRSVGVRYAGTPLAGSMRYSWTVNVWDQAGVKRSATSWFETGLMEPDVKGAAWGGAKWIGGGARDVVLYAPYLSIFDVEYGVTIAEGSSRASFIYGANDARLMDRFKNVYQLANRRDESYVRVELDVEAVETGGKARLNVYRVGYKPSDSATVPLKSFEIDAGLISKSNTHAEHRVEMRSQFGTVTFSIDGKPVASGAGAAAQVNPYGRGGDYLAFGLLCEIGFAAEKGQTASFRGLAVRNNRAPRNVLFSEELAGGKGLFAGAGVTVEGGRYVVKGGERGVFVARDPSRNAMPMLRATFETKPKPIAAARLYVTARGIYEAFVNGKRVGEDYYNPGLTQYNITHLYQTYDVTALVKPGAKNAIGAMLGEGWWSGLLSFGTIWNHFGDRQSLLAKLTVTYQDGTGETVVSDERWKSFAEGPTVYSSLDNGEVYDAARERAVGGWSTATYDDRAWKAAVEVPLEGTAFIGADVTFGNRPGTPILYDKLSLVGQIGNPAGVYTTLTAKSVKEVRPGVFVYDMGQNMVGVPRVQIASGKAGARMTLRYAEMLYPKLAASGANVGLLMTENYRAALSQDVYTMKAGAQTFQPRFTSHGYQYVEITGIEKALPLTAVQGVAISSVRELSAGYKSSNERVNRLWSNLVWSNIDNFLTIPTDCPQRNERMGWSGDINVFSRTATYVSNADAFLTRHMQAMRDVQGANGRFTDIAPVGGGFGGVLWGSAGIVVAWEAYQQYGDVGLLERHYPAMAAYMNYLDTTLDAKTGLTNDGVLGDWLGPQNQALGAPFLATAYHAYDLGIMAKVAGVLGRSADAAKYQAAYEKRKAFFNRTFVNAEGRTMATGSGGFGGPPATSGFRLGDTQTSYAVGLGMGLFDDPKTMGLRLAETVRRENKDDSGAMRPAYSLMTGFIGTAWISQALSESGQSELAYRLLQNRQYPSWLYPIEQGATTIWERLNGYTVENGFGGNNGMNSFNHYSFGAVGQWLMANSLGIQRGEPGFHRFVLRPEPDLTGEMTWAEGFYDSPYGRIESSWKRDGNVVTVRVSVPANTTATLYLPGTRVDGGASVVELVSGKWEYRIQTPR